MDFPLSERDRRFGRVRELMAKHEVDGLVMVQNPWIFGRGHVRYLANFLSRSRHCYLIFPLNGEPIAVGIALVGGWIQSIRKPSGFGSIGEQSVPQVIEALKEMRLDRGTIGLDSVTHMTADFYLGLTSQLKTATFTHAEDIVDEIMMVKSPEEIRQVERTVEMEEKAFEVFAGESKPGRTQREVYAEVMRTIIAEGGEFQALTCFTCSGSYPLLFDRPSDTRLKQGDVFQYYPEPAGPGGYYAHFSRVVSLGEPSREIQEMWDELLQFQQHTIRTLAPERTAEDVYKAYVEMATKGGYRSSEGWLAWVGHGMGLDSGERPHLTQGDNTVLKPGMIIAVHVPFPRKDAPMLMLADTYVITETGSRCLSKTPPNIRII